MPFAVKAPAPPADARRRANHGRDLDEDWKDYKHQGDDHSRNRLIRHYMTGHVRKLAERLHAGLPRRVDVDDLMQEGFLGLLDAMDRFEIDRNVRFETFSSRRIYGAMRDYLRAIDPAPRLSRRRAKSADVAIDDFSKGNGRAPTDHELCALLGMTPAKYLKIAVRDRPAAMVSYQTEAATEPADADNDAMAGFEDREQPSPYDTAEHEDLKRWLSVGFTRRDRLILILYYYEQITMREIGRTLGISESRVSQRLDSILACLKARLLRMDGEGQLLRR